MATHDPVRWQRVKDLLQQALELDTEKRASFLTEACQGDVELREEVVSLLKHENDAEEDGFLSSQSIESTFGADGRDTPSVPRGRGLRVRCPQCHTTVEVFVDTPSTDITCPTCDSHFSLAGEDADTRAAHSVTTIGHFELVERLGVGAYGAVWKARDIELDRTVAIKIPRKGQLNVAETEQFIREARAAAQLRHPNIVSVHEVGRHEDSVYIVSDLVRGVTLADWLTAHQATPLEAVKLCLKVAKALEHAHRAGVIHRDLKPQNIMIDKDGDPHLMDFGLARREAGEITMTVEGQILGTPAYMSPEQAKGEGHQADGRTDVYSLGVILFELLTGKRPFRGNTRMLIHQVLHDDAPSPRRFNSMISQDLDTICLKCLEKDQDNRYASADVVARELSAYLDGKPIQARPPRPVERTWRWCRRHPALAAVALLLSSASIVISTLALWALEASRVADIERGKAEHAESNVQKLNQEIESSVLIALSDMQARLAFAAIESGRTAEGGLLFASAADTATSSDKDRWRANLIRAREWQSLCPRPIRAFSVAPREASGFQLHPNNMHVLVSESLPGGPLLYRVWDLQTESPLTPIFGLACFSPDGNLLATVDVTNPNELSVFAFPTLARLKSIECDGAVTALRFSPSGKRLAVASRRLIMCETKHDFGLVCEAPLSNNAIGIDIHESERFLLASCVDGKARLFAVTEGEQVPENEQVERVLNATRSTMQLMFDPVPHASNLGGRVTPAQFLDGELGFLTVSTEAPAVEIRNLENGQLEWHIAAPAAIDSLSISPDRQQVVLSHYSEPNWAVRAWDIRSRRQLTVFEHQRDIPDACIDSLGVRLMTACADGVVRISDLSDASRRNSTSREGPGMIEIEHQGEVTCCEFSTDGRRILTAQKDGLIRLWDVPLEANRRADFRTMDWDGESEAALSSDGRFAAPSHWGLARTLKEVRVVDVPSRQSAGVALSLPGFLNASTFSPDGNTLVTLTSTDDTSHQPTSEVKRNNQPGWVSFWNWRTGETTHATRTSSEPVDGFFEKTGESLVVACANGDLLWIGSEVGNVIHKESAEKTAYGGAIRRRWLTYNPNVDLLAITARVRGIQLRSMDGELIHQLHKDAYWHNAVFSDDGVYMAACSFAPNSPNEVGDRNVVSIWKVETGASIAELRHSDAPLSVQFSHNNRFVVTACRDGEARVWEWQSETLLVSLGHRDEVFDAKLSHDGRCVFTTCRGGYARVWEMKTGLPLTPEWAVGGSAYQIHWIPQFDCALVGGNTAGFHVFDFALNLDKGDASHYLNTYEILSGKRMVNRSGVPSLSALTTSEWLDRWRQQSKRGGFRSRPKPVQR